MWTLRSPARRAARPLFFSFSALLALASAAAPSACGSSATTSTLVVDAGADSAPDAPVVVPDAGPYDAAPPPGPPPSCEKYCATVMANCDGDHLQYASEADCARACALFIPGAPSDRTDNTLACRQHHAGNPSKTDPARFCEAAGPFGGGVCGDRCAAFCEITLAVCTAGVDGGPPPYADMPACATACANFSFAGLADGGGPTPSGPETGDTLDCRMYHAARAIADAAGHCADTAERAPRCK